MHNPFDFFKYLTFKRAINLLQIAVNYLALKIFSVEVFTPVPLSLSIELTNICNLKCPQCSTGLDWYNIKKGHMTFAMFKRIIDGFSDKVIMLQLHFRGESMLHNDFYKMVRYASDKKLYTSLFSNGHFLKDNSDKLVDSRLSHINISLDGMSQETYQVYRKGGCFNRVMKGVSELVEVKNKRNSSSPRITLQMIASAINEKEIIDFKRLKSIGVNKCLVKTMQIIDEKTQGVFVDNVAKFNREKKEMKKVVCYKTLTTSVITWDGKTLPCCNDNEELFVLNKLIEINDYEKCSSTDMRAFRKSLRKGELKPEMCLNCEETAKKIYV